MSGTQGGGTTTPIITHANERPKDLFSAISQIEMYAGSEELGSNMPELFATTKERTDYFTLGMRSMLSHSYISLLLAPITTAVIGDKFPIFGTFEPDLFQKFVSYILSFGYSIAFMLLFVHVAKISTGTLSKILSTNLLIGMTIGAIMKFFAAITIYGLGYFIILTPKNIGLFFTFLSKVGLSNHYFNLITFIVNTLKSSLMPASYLFFYTTLGIILTPWSVVIYKKIANKEEKL